ncbi:hypothetical protein EX30DRAFT_371620 [Ascodesmis nigricans]|uniref:Uncharacterized protein n=1 Tax=Ascodesmis nigricans TaxID=341454 RepID=A0A4S2MXG3_9PEZI|nr:hypothetical protein EX30DRAFT_371620 [Ascodesmis nigricans]
METANGMAPNTLIRQASTYKDDVHAIEWAGGVASLISALIGIFTLLTVYVAAIQVLNRRPQYQLGASRKSLEPWKDVIVSSSIFRMQTCINAPKVISVPDLLKHGRDLDLDFLKGFSHKDKQGLSPTMRITSVIGLRKSSTSDSS